MIVCSCNVFSDLEVQAAVFMADPPTMAQVYRHLGHEPTCGRCATRFGRSWTMTNENKFCAETVTHRHSGEAEFRRELKTLALTRAL
jgi:bacterioferritin-associated ferredoxin